MNSICASCWAGQEAYGSNDNFESAWADWQVPCIPLSASLNETGYRFSTWVGLGGDQSFNPNTFILAQAGVDATYQTQTLAPPNPGGFTGPPIVLGPGATYQAWVEALGQAGPPEPEHDVFAVNCGDTVTAEVVASSTNHTMMIEDPRQGDFYSESFSFADTTTAECIVEQPSAAARLGLLDFGTQTFSDCQTYEANSNTSGGLNLFTNKPWISQTVTRTIPGPFGPIYIFATEAAPGPIDTSNNNGSFSVFWERS